MKCIVLILTTATLFALDAMPQSTTVAVGRKEKPSRYCVLDLTSSQEKRPELARHSVGVEELSSDGKPTNHTEGVFHALGQWAFVAARAQGWRIVLARR